MQASTSDRDLTQKGRVTLYRTARCPFCVAAEQLLRAKGVLFTQVYLDQHADHRGFVENILPGHRTVPLVVIDGEAIGGFEQLQRLDSLGGLDRLSIS